MKATTRTNRRRFLTASTGFLAISDGRILGGDGPIDIEPRSSGEYGDLAGALARFEAALAARARAVAAEDRAYGSIEAGDDVADEDLTERDKVHAARLSRLQRARASLSRECERIWREQVGPMMEDCGAEMVFYRGRFYADSSLRLDEDSLPHVDCHASKLLVLQDDQGRGRLGI